MRGQLKFSDNETIAFIQFDFPLRTDETGEVEEVELVLFGTRRSQYAPVKITDGYDRRRFQIIYESDDASPRMRRISIKERKKSILEGSFNEVFNEKKFQQ